MRHDLPSVLILKVQTVAPNQSRVRKMVMTRPPKATYIPDGRAWSTRNGSKMRIQLPSLSRWLPSCSSYRISTHPSLLPTRYPFSLTPPIPIHKVEMAHGKAPCSAPLCKPQITHGCLWFKGRGFGSSAVGESWLCEDLGFISSH
jgi:hypothetical protein